MESTSRQLLENKKELRFLVTPFKKDGGQDWIRTNVHLREQIYSLPPLTTRPPTHVSLSWIVSQQRRGNMNQRRFAQEESETFVINLINFSIKRFDTP